MRLVYSVVFCISIIALSSCRSATSSVKDTLFIPDSLREAVPPTMLPPFNNAKLVSFKAESDVEMMVESTPVSGSCSISIMHTDSLLMTFHGPFGILIGKLSACPQYLKYFDALNTEVLEGDPQSESLAQRMPIPLTYNDIIHLMRCEVPYSAAQYKLNKIQEEEAALVFAYSADERFVDFVKLSAKDGTVLTYQRKSRRGEVLLNVKYTDYIVKDGVNFPKSISLNFPLRNMTAKFAVTELTINPVGERYSFNVPKGVKRTKLD